MGSFRIEINNNKKMKQSSEFTEQEKKTMFHFLDKNDDDELALDFVKRWFNITQFTVMMLIMEKQND